MSTNKTTSNPRTTPIEYIDDGHYASGIRAKHESFGCITINRTYGGNNQLFCSGVDHDVAIELTIKRADGVIKESDMSHYSKNEIVRVNMSPMQWSILLSSFGVGEGVPCTIVSENHIPVPKVEGVWGMKDRIINSARNDIGKIIDERMVSALNTLKDARKNGRKIGAKEMDQLIGDLDMMHHIPSNIEFYYDRLEEYAEQLNVESTKNAECLIDGVKMKIADRLLEGSTHLLTNKDG